MSDTIFSLLVDLAEKERLAVSRPLAEANAKLAAAKEQLHLLQSYHRDYQMRMVNPGRSATDGQSMRNFNAFVMKLDTALKQQEREVAACESRCQRIQEADQKAHRKLRSFESLRDRRAEEAKAFERQRMQKQNDEFGARAAGRRSQLS
jgi:flagellar protein FliJ